MKFQVTDVSKQPHLFHQYDVEDGQFLLPVSALYSLRPLSEGNSVVFTGFSTTVSLNLVDEKLTTIECEVQPPSVITICCLSLTIEIRYSFLQRSRTPG